MRLEELLNTITESTRDDWFVMESNTLLNQVSTDDNNMVYADCHTNRASYRPDISIGLVWGLNCNNNFKDEWVNKHPDPHASSHYLDVLYNGMIVYRAIYVIIDGGRSYMPLPHRNIDNSNKTIGWYITSKEHEFYRLFNEIQGFNTQYNSYLKRCGIEVR